MKGVWEALSDGTRRKILTLLRKKPHTAGEIAENFTLTGATVSHHLNVLKECGLIVGEKKAQTITYSLNTTVFQEILKSLAEFFDKE